MPENFEDRIRPDELDFTEVGEGIWESPISGLLYIDRGIHGDERGYYRELYRVPDIEEVIGMELRLLQSNLSFSAPRVIRGIHAEGWNKIVHVAMGTAFCVWVDLRRESDTFLQLFSLTLGQIDGAVFVPVGVGNSFGVVGKEPVVYVYDVDKTYDQRDLSWDSLALNPFDPELSIEWPIYDAIISERDRSALSLQELLERLFERGKK